MAERPPNANAKANVQTNANVQTKANTKTNTKVEDFTDFCKENIELKAQALYIQKLLAKRSNWNPASDYTKEKKNTLVRMKCMNTCDSSSAGSENCCASLNECYKTCIDTTPYTENDMYMVKKDQGEPVTRTKGVVTRSMNKVKKALTRQKGGRSKRKTRRS